MTLAVYCSLIFTLLFSKNFNHLQHTDSLSSFRYVSITRETFDFSSFDCQDGARVSKAKPVSQTTLRVTDGRYPAVSAPANPHQSQFNHITISLGLLFLKTTPNYRISLSIHPSNMSAPQI